MATTTMNPTTQDWVESSRPTVQTQLLLHKPYQAYELHHGGPVPSLQFGELMVEILAIGLNPIDWKSAYVPHQNTIRLTWLT
jgi:hypothetical protein